MIARPSAISKTSRTYIWRWSAKIGNIRSDLFQSRPRHFVAVADDEVQEGAAKQSLSLAREGWVEVLLQLDRRIYREYLREEKALTRRALRALGLFCKKSGRGDVSK